VAGSPDGDGVRLAELVAAISLATDIGTGQPMEHALRTCRLSMAVAAELGMGAGTATDIYHVALLRFLGCTADAPETAQLAGGDNVAFIAAMAPAYMGSTGEVVEALAHAYERWDGRGLPDGLAGEAVPQVVRVVVVARDAVLWQRLAGTAAALEVLDSRRGHAYDPAVVDAVRAVGLPVAGR
jgi:HD domain